MVFERNSAGTDKEMVENAAVLVNRAVDLIVASGLPASRVARDATTTIPIVMVTETDPVAAGLVSSLGRPGGNVTGVTLRNPELAGKRLELLKEAVPGLVRVGVLWNPGNWESVEHWQAAQPAARLLGLELRSLVRGARCARNRFALRHCCAGTMRGRDRLERLPYRA